ncbi:MAG: hypothetical protein PVH19_10315 [Planctomycetia bacterium]|jgi:hypothetical protein
MKNIVSVLDNRMNPIVVKELRQGLQSWFIIVIVNLMLVALSLTCILLVMLNPDITEEATGGRGMFYGLQIVLFSATIVCVPLYVLHRLQTERDGTNVDLFFTTTLKPHKIVRGKFVAGMSLITLFYSVCLPFLLFTYFLRGYDIPTMLFSLAMGYLLCIPILMAAIVLGSWSLPYVFTLFIKIAALAGLILVVCLLCAINEHEILRPGIQQYLREKGFLWICALFILVGLLFTKLLGTMAIALLAPPSSNRTAPLRVWTSISLFLLATGFAIFGTYARLSGWMATGEALLGFSFIWTLITLGTIAVIAVITICEPDKFSNRIMLQRPSFMPLRLITFPFTHSASAGFTWIILHTTLVFGVMTFAYYIAPAISPHAGIVNNMINDIDEIMPWTVLFFACIMAYALLAKWIMQPFFTTYKSGLWVFLYTATFFGSMGVLYNIAVRLPFQCMHNMLNAIGSSLPQLLFFFFYIMAFALIAKWTLRAFCPNAPAKHTWATFLIIFMILTISSMLVCFIMDTRHWDKLPLWKFFNPMAEVSYYYADHETQLMLRIFVDSVWAILMLLLCAPKMVYDLFHYVFAEPVARGEIESTMVDHVEIVSYPTIQPATGSTEN